MNPVCLALSPIALAIVFWYSLAKRFTTWTQLFLGLSMAVAPVGGWLAVGGRSGWEPWLLAVAIGMWVGGFDVLYACQDLEFDRGHGLRSIPVRYGVPASLAISRAMHVIAVACLLALALVAPLGTVYVIGVVLVASMLVYAPTLREWFERDAMPADVRAFAVDALATFIGAAPVFTDAAGVRP